MSSLTSLDSHTQEQILGLAKVPFIVLVCKPLQIIFLRVCESLIQSGDIRFLSELRSRHVVAHLIQQFGLDIQHWCEQCGLSIIHLIHPTINLDSRLCELSIGLSKGMAYEYLPVSLRRDRKLTLLALQESKGASFKFLETDQEIDPEFCQVCLALLSIDHFFVTGKSSAFQAMRQITAALESKQFPPFDAMNSLYHRRRNKGPELELSRSLASENVAWRVHRIRNLSIVC